MSFLNFPIAFPGSSPSSPESPTDLRLHNHLPSRSVTLQARLRLQLLQLYEIVWDFPSSLKLSPHQSVELFRTWTAYLSIKNHQNSRHTLVALQPKSPNRPLLESVPGPCSNSNILRLLS
ncbi:hypothetical protein V6000_002479 [Aspergillus fumigatus]|jgi:hypothetical protein